MLLLLLLVGLLPSEGLGLSGGFGGLLLLLCMLLLLVPGSSCRTVTQWHNSELTAAAREQLQ